MRKRVTVNLDVDVIKKVREKQAKEIIKSESSISFSSVLNDILHKSLK